MLKYIIIFFSVFLSHTLFTSAQEFDEKESDRLTKFQGKPIIVSQRVLSAVQKAQKLTLDQAEQALQLFVDAGNKRNNSNTDSIVIDSMIAKYHVDLKQDEEAIIALERLLSKDQKPRNMEIGAYNSLAVLYHNTGDYLNSIKNLHRWQIYTPADFHQLHYMLSDNYQNLGDLENAYKAYLKATKTYQLYLEDGPDLGEDLKIRNYEKMVSNLKTVFSNGIPESYPSASKIDVPAPEDEFWMIKFNPKFPTAALRKGRTGSAKVKYDIKSNGRVDNFEVLEVSNSLFKRAARSHARRMIYVRYENSDKEYIARDVIYDLNFIFKRKR